MTARESVLQAAAERNSHPVMLAYLRDFVELAGDHKAALLLSQLLYWTDRTRNPEGWIYKTHADWKRELGLGRYEVDHARKQHAAIGVLQEKIRMANGSRTLHYRLDIATLCAVMRKLPLSDVADGEGDQMDVATLEQSISRFPAHR